MELRHLHYLDRVIAAGGFRSAARELGVAQPTLTAQIRRLELDLGVALLDRTRRPIRMTPTGEIVVARARELLASVARFDSEITRIAKLQSGQLRLGTNRALAPIISPVLAAFTTQYPQIEVVQQTIIREGPGLLLRGELDVCVHARPVVDEQLPRELESTRLFAFEQVFAVRPGHALAGRAQVNLAELANERLIVSTGSSGGVLKQAFADAGIPAHVGVETDDLDMVASLVAQGAGIGFAPEFIVRRSHHPLKTFTVRDLSYTHDVLLTWATRLGDAPALASLVAFVSSQQWSTGARRSPRVKPPISPRNPPNRGPRRGQSQKLVKKRS